MMVVPNVQAGVELDLERIARGNQDLLNGGLAHAARALALQLDNDPSATAASNCVGELRKVLAELRALGPEPEAKGGLHALEVAREQRRVRVADAEAKSLA